MWEDIKLPLNDLALCCVMAFLKLWCKFYATFFQVFNFTKQSNDGIIALYHPSLWSISPCWFITTRNDLQFNGNIGINDVWIFWMGKFIFGSCNLYSYLPLPTWPSLVSTIAPTLTQRGMMVKGEAGEFWYGCGGGQWTGQVCVPDWWPVSLCEVLDSMWAMETEWVLVGSPIPWPIRWLDTHKQLVSLYDMPEQLKNCNMICKKRISTYKLSA